MIAPARGGTGGPGPAAPPPDGHDESSEAAALAAQAETLYERRRYRRVIALCDRLEALGYPGGIVAVMREGCENALRRRFSIVCTLAVSCAGLLLIGTLAWLALTVVYIEPPPGTLGLAELQAQTFKVTRPLGRHRGYRYTWQLLDADGHPVPTPERGSLATARDASWSSTYTPGPGLVRAADGARTVLRRIVVRVSSESGTEAALAEWTVEVADKPAPPSLRSAEPERSRPIAVAPGGSRTFRVDARDGDGGTAVTCTWAMDGKTVLAGPARSWTYAPDLKAEPELRQALLERGTLTRTLTCQISNQFGEPSPRIAQWKVRVVASDTPPRIIRVEPNPSPYYRLAEGELLQLKAYVFDPDKDDTVTYRWEVDGQLKSTADVCKLVLPYDTTITEKEVTLRLTVTDSCGASAQQAWPLVIVNTPHRADFP